MTTLVVIAWLLVGFGLALTFLELLLPTGGFMLALGGTAAAGGVVMGFMDHPSTGWTILISLAVLSPLSLFAFFSLWPHTPLGRQFFIKPTTADTTFTSQPALQALESLVGATGTAISPQRPSGCASFSGKRVDCITEGLMVEPGTSLRCLRISGGKVVVRPYDESSPHPLEGPEIRLALDGDISGDGFPPD